MQKARRHTVNCAPTACKQTVSGSFHSLAQGSFHLSLTVLVRYRSLGSIQPYQMVLVVSHRISPVPRYSGYPTQTKHYQYGTFTLFGPTFQQILVLCSLIIQVLQPRSTNALRFGLLRVRSPLLAESLLFSSPPGTQMFQFPGLSSLLTLGLQPSGLPHSDIYGSKIICISPQLFAAYHVLHRLREPRHPPFALICFLLLMS